MNNTPLNKFKDYDVVILLDLDDLFSEYLADINYDHRKLRADGGFLEALSVAFYDIVNHEKSETWSSSGLLAHRIRLVIMEAFEDLSYMPSKEAELVSIVEYSTTVLMIKDPQHESEKVVK